MKFYEQNVKFPKVFQEFSGSWHSEWNIELARSDWNRRSTNVERFRFDSWCEICGKHIKRTCCLSPILEIETSDLRSKYGSKRNIILLQNFGYISYRTLRFSGLLVQQKLKEVILVTGTRKLIIRLVG